MYGIFFTDDYHGYVIGAGGTILKTNTGGVTGIEIIKNEILPDDYSLLQNYPNPFNPTTTIEFQIPEQSKISLIIYDVLGNKITKLVDDNFQVGNYSVQFNASNLASGIYFYRLITNKATLTKKMSLIK